MPDVPFWIQSLDDCRDISVVGGKAVNLGVLLRAGFPVPGGFVVTTAAYRSERSESNGHSNGNGYAQAENGSAADSTADSLFSQELTRQILEAYAAMGGGPVAVRSSATAEDMAGASMAGQYDTFLHVHDQPTLLDAIGRCWRSLDSARTRSYLREHGIDIRQVAMAVVVQKLVRADVAGVLFTANPQTGNRNEMLAEAAWGLGEAVVSGRVQPDVLRLNRDSGEPVEHRVSDKRIMIPAGGNGEVETPEELRRVACLQDGHINQLWQLGRRAADHFGGEQDIEFAVQDGSLYLLQSRPITTLEEAEAYSTILDQTRKDLESELAAGYGPWVRHNLGETLPHPTPLTWSVMQKFMTGAGGFGRMYQMAGFEPSEDCKKNGFLRLVAGRIYMDVSRAAGIFFDRFPFKYDLSALRSNPDAAQAPPTLPDGSLFARWQAGRRIGTINKKLAVMADTLDRELRQRTFPQFGDYVAGERAKDLSKLSPAELAELWRDRQTKVMDEFAPQSLLPSLVEGMVLAELKQFLAEQIWDQDIDELATTLSSSPTPNMTLLADAGLFEVAADRRTLLDWLTRFGHRAAGEFDLATPRWREQPEAVKKMADRLAGGADPLKLHEAHAGSIRKKVEAIRAKLSPTAAKEFDRHIDRVWRYISFREDGKFFLMLGYDLLREVGREIGRRFGIRDDVFYLTEEEMLDGLESAPRATALAPSPGTPGEGWGGGQPEAYRSGVAMERSGRESPVAVTLEFSDPMTQDSTASALQHALQEPPPQPSPGVPGEGAKGLAALMASRKREFRAEARITLPHVIDSSAIETLGAPPKLDDVGMHEAFAVSTGVATGPARIVRSPAEAGDLGNGYVLVCPSTDPNWTPLFVNAAALVLECGGTLSHGAVVAREMGLPAVVLADATRRFTEGQIIRVDGHHGAVGPAVAEVATKSSPVVSPIDYASPTIEPVVGSLPQSDGTPEVPADPNDTRIAPALMPPPPGPLDRRAAHWRLAGIVIWGIYLALALWLPEFLLYQPSLRLLDLVLWPLVPAFGKIGAVAIIAAGVGILTMILQRLMTDNARLLEAKRRSTILGKEAAKLPPDSPRRAAINRLTAPVQVRLFGAAMVPMAVALGPMVMTFFWFPARVDPASWSPPPGTPMQVSATLSRPGKVRIEVDPALKLEGDSTAEIADAKPVKSALQELLSAWENPAKAKPDEPLAAQLAKIRIDSRRKPQELREFIDSEVRSDPAIWSLQTPSGQSGRFPITVTFGETPVTVYAVLGDSHPPEIESDVRAETAVGSAEVKLTSIGRSTHSFWEPFASVTWKPMVDHEWNRWDAGWISIYLLAYLPAMYLARKVLSIA